MINACNVVFALALVGSLGLASASDRKLLNGFVSSSAWGYSSSAVIDGQTVTVTDGGATTSTGATGGGSAMGTAVSINSATAETEDAMSNSMSNYYAESTSAPGFAEATTMAEDVATAVAEDGGSAAAAAGVEGPGASAAASDDLFFLPEEAEAVSISDGSAGALATDSSSETFTNQRSYAVSSEDFFGTARASARGDSRAFADYFSWLVEG